jgi:hypothetical protein
MQFNYLFDYYGLVFVSQCQNELPKKHFKAIGDIFDVWHKAKSILIFKSAINGRVQIT